MKTKNGDCTPGCTRRSDDGQVGLVRRLRQADWHEVVRRVRHGHGRGEAHDRT
jgi:hypothetical protein